MNQPRWGREFLGGFVVVVVAVAYFGVVLHADRPRLFAHILDVGENLLVGLLAGAAAIVFMVLARPRTRSALLNRIRAWLVYGRLWRSVMVEHDLVAKRGKDILVPPRRGTAFDGDLHTMTVQMLHGQNLDSWRQRMESLAHAFGATTGDVRPHETKPMHVVLTFDRAPAAPRIRTNQPHRPDLRLVTDTRPTHQDVVRPSSAAN